MTDQTTTETDTTEAEEVQTPHPPAATEDLNGQVPNETPEAEPGDESDPAAKARGEAAKYRTRLREAETERDALASRVATLQRAEVARLAGEKLAQGTDVFDIGRTELADVLDADGNVDPALVGERVTELLASRPGLAAPVTTWPDVGQGKPPAPPAPARSTWAEALSRSQQAIAASYDRQRD